MPKFLNGVYKYSLWIILGLGLLGYFAFKVLVFDATIGVIVKDYYSYVHTGFVIALHLLTQEAAWETGDTIGMASEEFDLADKLNNQIIKSVNNEMTDFRAYTKRINEHELQTLREDYLFKVGDKKVEELTKHELKVFKKLKPIQHDIYGFNLPLYYEMSKNGKVAYQATMSKSKGKNGKRVTKFINAILYSLLTIGMVFNLQGIGEALLSVLTIATMLCITALMAFIPRVTKYKRDLPRKVIMKNIYYNSYIQYKNGTHKLKELVEEKPKEEVKIIEPTKKDFKEVATILPGIIEKAL